MEYLYIVIGKYHQWQMCIQLFGNLFGGMHIMIIGHLVNGKFVYSYLIILLVVIILWLIWTEPKYQELYMYIINFYGIFSFCLFYLFINLFISFYFAYRSTQLAILMLCSLLIMHYLLPQLPYLYLILLKKKHVEFPGVY